MYSVFINFVVVTVTLEMYYISTAFLLTDGRAVFEPNRPTFLISGLSASIFTVFEPTVGDSGNYTCIASTSAILADRDFAEMIETSRSVQVEVEGMYNFLCKCIELHVHTSVH